MYLPRLKRSLRESWQLLQKVGVCGDEYREYGNLNFTILRKHLNFLPDQL